MATPVARRAPYKDFLQPALQRRFAGTATILLGLAYFESLTLSRWNSLILPWFPLGPSGPRALALFICVLPIIILRIANAHMGIRTSNSLFDTLFHTVLRPSTIETVLTYIISAFLFSQVYLMSTPEEAGIRWISQATGRSRLNEHALFYTVNLLVLGLVQGITHTALDMDRLVLGVVEGTRGGNAGNAPDANGNGTDSEGDAARPSDTENWAAKIGERTPVLLVRCGMLAITVAMVNYTVLYYFIRIPAWRSAMGFFRFFYKDLPKYNFPVTGAPWSVWMLGRTTWASFLLSLLWYFGEIAFRVQLSREPLKRGQPLSSESKDPSGSLLNGLKSKKPRIFAFAMWELAFIARDYAARRQAIFEDIDRKDGPMWSQIYAVCMETVRELERRVDEWGKAPAPPEPAPAPTQPRERLSQPLRANDVLAPRHVAKTSLVTNTVAQLVTSPGRTPAQDWAPVIKRKAGQVADQVLTQQQREAVRPEALQGHLGTLSLRIMALPIVGPIFQQSFGRRLAKAVLGSPYAETSVYINAAYALSRLAVHSLAEDRYGNVQRDVPTIIRTFTTVIRKLETFRDGFPTHWTDLAQNRQCPEVSEVLNALKDDLAALVEAFGPYSGDLRLSRADMRLAREASDRPQEKRQPEMQQAR
ncbi:nucleoporin protein Ndc1-Nup [Xylaria bambusicola]|uniref:nucleoporin protein Ndc1-Nup n=1 Tax=Xylaria bambusicola TaxID=326684 RepID=UPI002007954B|nr:nucleoporin protein Ndc1-Nup [Xylaria bambusicola]KAI0505307.1 nucleoporin protein Ndc1-Nup [Xylaria bambusicola]